MSNGSRLPARSNFRRGNRRGGSQTLNATNVPQVRGSVDQGQRIPNKGLFGEYETENLANTRAGLMNLGNTVFNVSTKLKQREDKRFLLQAEDELDANIKSLIEESKEALNLSNSEDIKGLNGKLETRFNNYDE